MITNMTKIAAKKIQYAFLRLRNGTPLSGIEKRDTKKAVGKKTDATIVRMREVPESKNAMRCIVA